MAVDTRGPPSLLGKAKGPPLWRDEGDLNIRDSVVFVLVEDHTAVYHPAQEAGSPSLPEPASISVCSGLGLTFCVGRLIPRAVTGTRNSVVFTWNPKMFHDCSQVKTALRLSRTLRGTQPFHCLSPHNSVVSTTMSSASVRFNLPAATRLCR